MNNVNTKALVRLAMLTAISVVLVALIHFPLFPAASFLEYDPADVPILLASVLFGPVAGIIVTVTASIIQGLTVSASGGVIGIVMHILATGTFSVVVGLFAKKKDEKKLILGLVLGVISMAAVMAVNNLIFTPIYTGMPVSVIASMLIPVFIPFNLLKAGLNAVIAYIIYLPLKKFASRG